MTIRTLVLAAAFGAGISAALPVAGQAQDAGSTYLSLGVGPTWYQDAKVTGSGVNNTIDFGTGWGLTGAVGHAYSNNVRAEVELGYRRAGVDSISGTSGASGNVSVPSLMGNIYYDFRGSSAVTPYLGLGLGVARVDANSVRTLGSSTADDHDTVFAYQGIAGLSYKIDQALALFGEYRHMGSQDPDFRLANGTKVSGEFDDNRILVGLRWSFGAPKLQPVAETKPMPAPPPAPKPAPAPAAPAAMKDEAPVARTYLVFFDWDKANIRADSAAILSQAAANYPKAKVTLIEATGHADRSGPDKYNLGLSKRRADAVKAELVRLGVAAKDIVVKWKGEREPLVPTADGVREPQNRRVEIVFQ